MDSVAFLGILWGGYMASKYDRINQELSILYNRNLEQGRYDLAIENLEWLAKIARLENRPNDESRLKEIEQYIRLMAKA